MSVNNKESKRWQGCLIHTREEFRLSKAALNHPTGRLFVTAQCVNQIFYCIWTAFWSIFHLIITALQPYFRKEDLPNPKWFSFLTNWGYITLTAYSVVDAITTLYVAVKKKEIINEETTSIAWYMKIQWILFNVSTVVAITITLLFYILLPPASSPNSILLHAINSVYAISNLIVCAKPVQILHVYQPFIFAFVYVIFSLIYQKSGGGTIYDILDWDRMPNTVLLALGCLFIVIPLVHLLCFFIYTLRIYVHFSCCKKVEEDKSIPLQNQVTSAVV